MKTNFINGVTEVESNALRKKPGCQLSSKHTHDTYMRQSWHCGEITAKASHQTVNYINH